MNSRVLEFEKGIKVKESDLHYRITKRESNLSNMK
jgi:hypothetical protein